MTETYESGQSELNFSRLQAFRHFAEFEGKTQSQEHIRPLHEYVTCRLVLEGGFSPHEISPAPPLRVVQKPKNTSRVEYDLDCRNRIEATILGGLKTKSVDIVVTKDGIGPVLAVSCKGMTGAVRNLTNRLEETIGECTNIHIAYPALVFGYLFLLRGNRQNTSSPTDMVINDDGQPVDGVLRFHQALGAMTGRTGLRNDSSRYESIAMALVEVASHDAGTLIPQFPPTDSPVHFDRFFESMYRRYDERFVVSAPQLAHKTRRNEWSPDSPAFEAEPFSGLDYELRISRKATKAYLR